ncbi:hypothetical protein V6N13_016791 [Hibiscus sabdariffa]
MGKGLHRCVTRVVAEDKLEVLDSCVVAWCKDDLRGRMLVEELWMVKVQGCSVMRISGEMVLLLFATGDERKALLDRTDLDRWFVRTETFSNLVGLWGRLVRVENTTMEPQSFERARLLIESNVMDRIEETVEVKTVEESVILARIQEVEVVHSHDIVCPCDPESEDSDNDVVSEEAAMDQRADFVEALEAVTLSPGTHEVLVEAEVVVFGECSVGQVPLLEWESNVGQQFQEFQLASKSHAQKNQEVQVVSKYPAGLTESNWEQDGYVQESNLEPVVSTADPTQFVEAQQVNPAVEVVLSKGLPRKVRSVKDLVIDTLTTDQRSHLLKAQGRGKRGRP